MRAVVVFVLVCLLASTVGGAFAQDADLPPAILSFTADVASVPLDDVEAGSASVNLSWQTINVRNTQQLHLYAYQLRTWQPVAPETPLLANGLMQAAVTMPLNFAAPLFRLTIEDPSGQVLDERLLEIPYADTQGTPQITQFSANLGSINRGDLVRGARVGVAWRISSRPVNSNLRFEQILDDGSAVSIELPRGTLWIPSNADNGVVAPVLTNGTSIRLRLSLIDLVSGNVYAQAELDIPVTTSATAATPQPGITVTAQPTISAPTATPLTGASTAVPTGVFTDTPTNMPDTANAQPIFVTGARDDGGNNYYTEPAACATIHWNFPSFYVIYLTNAEGQVLGPFEGVGELRTEPLHHEVYTLYVGGQPGQVAGTALSFDTPGSTQYPGNQANGFVHPSCA